MANGTSGTRGSSASGGTAKTQPTKPVQQKQNVQAAAPPAQPVMPKQRTRPSVVNNMQNFSRLTSAQQAAAINSALSTQLPSNLNSKSDLQKLLYSQGLTSAPDIVSDAHLKAMKNDYIVDMGGSSRVVRSNSLYRTVNSMYDGYNDISYTAPQIASMTMKSGQLYLPNGGKAVYGEGIYFATTRSASLAYGNTRGNMTKTCVMQAKFKPTAKIADYNTITRQVSAEISSGSQLGKALKKCSDPYSVYALCKGYQAMDNGYGYTIIMDRSCLAMTQTLTAK